MRKYDTVVRSYNANCDIPVMENCNSIMFTNTGDNQANVDGPDGMVLYAGTPGTILGDSRTIGGNEGEILAKKAVRLSFKAPQTAGQLVEVVQKYYVE